MDANFPGFLRGALTLVLLGATGCKGDGSLWLLLFEPNLEDPATYCETGITHNFMDANPITEEETEELMVVTQELTQSDSAVIGQITGGSEPVLVIATRLWLGEKDGSTTTFKWDATEDSSTTESIDNPKPGMGYLYTENLTSEVDEKIKLEFKGNEASGTYKTTQIVNQAWEETDVFDPYVGFTTGQIPAGQYLRVKAPAGDLVPAHNTGKEVECTAPICYLTVVSTCETSVKVTATELEADEQDYDGIGAGQRPAGVGTTGGGNGGGGDGGPPE